MKVMKILFWRLFIYQGADKNQSDLPRIIHYIKHDEEDNIDMFISFIYGQKGFLMLNAVEHTDESVADVKQALDKFFSPILYSLCGTGYHMRTYVKGVDDIPEEVESAKLLALEKMTFKERCLNHIQKFCYG